MLTEIFKVFHENGQEWTEKEITEYIDEHNLKIISLEGFRDFYIDPYGNLMLSDGFKNHHCNREKFIAKLNVEGLRKELKRLADDD